MAKEALVSKKIFKNFPRMAQIPKKTIACVYLSVTFFPNIYGKIDGFDVKRTDFET